jgi:hypothetical protein
MLTEPLPENNLSLSPEPISSLQEEDSAEGESSMFEDSSMFTNEQTECVTELENTLCGEFEPLEQLLRICKQKVVMPFADLLDP